MSIKNVIATLLLMPLCVQTAQAQEKTSDFGLFIEPAITYEFGRAAVDYPSPLSNSTGNAAGFGLGAKFGMHVSEAIFLALDARYSMPQYDDSSVDYDAGSVSTNWGPVLGVQMQDIGMRVWGTLILGGELNPKQSGNFDVSFSDASGYRIGTGFHIASVSLNIEYQQIKYGNTTLEEAGPFSPGDLNNVNLTNSTWIGSVSFPLEL